MGRKVLPEDRLELGIHLNVNRWLGEQIAAEGKLRA
jgi:hypothetical protein